MAHTIKNMKYKFVIIALGLIILFAVLYSVYIFKKDTAITFPRFHDYSVMLGEDLVKSVAINFNSNPEIDKYRQALDNIQIPDTNFAYSYRIFTIGCGTECHEVVVIDSSNGNIYFPKIISRVGIDFASDSKLLVVNPPKDIYEVYGNDPKDWPSDYLGEDLRTSFYVWENNQFNLIKTAEINYKIE